MLFYHKQWMINFLISSSLLLRSSQSVELQINDPSSINSAAKIVASGLLNYYTGEDYGNPVGMFSAPYYWWEAGGAWGSLLDYWWYTGDDKYNDMIKRALLAQVGEKWDYVPLNQSTTEGNDDQAFWGIAVMAAAERNFTNPAADEPQWLYLAQAVFNTMSDRWDDDDCGGGLRWQIFQWNSGYDYKNSVSNGGLFHIAARLARYTTNDTYVMWAEKVWDWMEVTKLIGGKDNYLVVYDGVKVSNNCSRVTGLQWSYNAGLLLSGAAYLFSYTKDPVWEDRLNKLLQGIGVFFSDGIMFEVACQETSNCNNDQRSFKAFLARFLGLTGQLVESTRATIDVYLQNSSIAAAQSCVGGTDGITCGLNWHTSGWDTFYGLGEQMAALEVIQNLRYKERPLPYTEQDGGSSSGHPAAGFLHEHEDNNDELMIKYRDKVGAAFATLFFGLSAMTMLLFIIM